MTQRHDTDDEVESERPPWKPDGADGRVLAFDRLPTGALLRLRTPAPRENTTEIVEVVDGEECIAVFRAEESMAAIQRYNELVEVLASDE